MCEDPEVGNGGERMQVTSALHWEGFLEPHNLQGPDAHEQRLHGEWPKDGDGVMGHFRLPPAIPPPQAAVPASVCSVLMHICTLACSLPLSSLSLTAPHIPPPLPGITGHKVKGICNQIEFRQTQKSPFCVSALIQSKT